MAISFFYIYVMATSFFFIYVMAACFFYIYAMATSFFYIYIYIYITFTFTNYGTSSRYIERNFNYCFHPAYELFESVSKASNARPTIILSGGVGFPVSNQQNLDKC